MPPSTETAKLLARARKSGTPVIHVVHKGKGALFNPDGPYFEIVAALRPQTGETIIEKMRVSAFADTKLEEAIRRTGRKNLIIVGFMTHNCVSSTARAATRSGLYADHRGGSDRYAGSAGWQGRGCASCHVAGWQSGRIGGQDGVGGPERKGYSGVNHGRLTSAMVLYPASNVKREVVFCARLYRWICAGFTNGQSTKVKSCTNAPGNRALLVPRSP